MQTMPWVFAWFLCAVYLEGAYLDYFPHSELLTFITFAIIVGGFGYIVCKKE